MTLMERVVWRAKLLRQGRPACLDLARSMVANKVGLEIGGPSAVFDDQSRLLPIYKEAAAIDNCDLSPETTWGSHSGVFRFSAAKDPGKNIFCDGSDLSVVASNSYDFILSSHNLEHFANPLRALKEWRRVTRPGGALVLVLPNMMHTFDHRRRPTTVEHMLTDFENMTQEDDLTHLEEILQYHDLDMDPLAGSPEQFRQRSLNNPTNRCLHHHVFNETNSAELLRRAGLTVLAVEVALPVHIFLLARMP